MFNFLVLYTYFSSLREITELMMKSNTCCVSRHAARINQSQGEKKHQKKSYTNKKPQRATISAIKTVQRFVDREEKRREGEREMALSLDIGLWSQKWHKMDVYQQRDFLLSQLEHSQESTSFKDVPLIMISLITEHHLKSLALSAAAWRDVSTSTEARNKSFAAVAADVNRGEDDNTLVPSPSTSVGHQQQFTFVTPSFIFREVWELLKPKKNVAAKVNLTEREKRLGNRLLGLGGDRRSDSVANSLNTSAAEGGGESSEASTPQRGANKDSDTSSATRIEFHRIEGEYLVEEEKRAALRREELQALKDVAPTIPSPVACDIMDGWSVGPQQLERKREAVIRAEEALIDIASRVVCSIKGIEADVSIDLDAEEENIYAKAKPSVSKAVRWLARRLLRSVLGYDVLIQRHEALLLENFDAHWNAVTPLSAIFHLLWASWDQRRVPNDIHSRDVLEDCRRTSFCPSLPWEHKECLILSLCANFTFVLFSFWTGTKWNLSEVLPQSLMAAKVFSRRKRTAATTGLLIDYLNVRSVYEDGEGEMARQIPEPLPFVRMLIKATAKVVEQRMPELSRALAMWSEGPLELNNDEVGAGAGPREKLLIAATRSWYESLFTAPTPRNTHYDAFHTYTNSGNAANPNALRNGSSSPRDAYLVEAEARLKKFSRLNSAGRSRTEAAGGVANSATAASSARPTSAQMLRRVENDDQYDSEGSLMSEADCSLFWRHFVAFGWPFVTKLGVQILLEASSNTPLLVHSGSPADLSAYALAGRAASGLSIYSSEVVNAPPPIVTDPKLEVLLRRVHLPRDFTPISLLSEFLDGPPSDYIDLNDLRVMQKALLVAINRLPSCVRDLRSTVGRIEQWDQCLYEALREETDPTIVERLRRWEQLFISSQHTKKKTRSILQATGAEVDAMERILPMVQSRY